jgi:hypothetical protein
MKDRKQLNENLIANTFYNLGRMMILRNDASPIYWDLDV